MKKLYLPKIFFDSCSFYPPQKDEKIAMSKIEKIVGSYEELAIEIPYSVKTELSKAPKWIEKKISMSIYTLPVSLTDEERNIIQEIRIILFGKNALLENNQEMDVIHLFEAQKYGCRYFITLGACCANIQTAFAKIIK